MVLLLEEQWLKSRWTNGARCCHLFRVLSVWAFHASTSRISNFIKQAWFLPCFSFIILLKKYLFREYLMSSYYIVVTRNTKILRHSPYSQEVTVLRETNLKLINDKHSDGDRVVRKNLWRRSWLARVCNGKKKVSWVEKIKDRESSMKKSKKAINSTAPPPTKKISTVPCWWSVAVKKWRWRQAMEHLVCRVKKPGVVLAGARKSWSGLKRRATCQTCVL